MAIRDCKASSFAADAERWFMLSAAEITSEDDGDALEALDQKLLRHPPTSALEVLVLLEVVRECVRGGGRVDGLDAEALVNMRDHVIESSHERGLAASFASLKPPAHWERPPEHRLVANG